MLSSVLLACLLSVPASADAGQGPLSVKRHVEPKSVLLGEPFEYRLVITHPKDQRYELITPSALGPFELLEHQRRRVDGEGDATTTFVVRLSLFELGKQKLPDLSFDVATETGRFQWVAEGLEVEGRSSLPPDAEEKGADLYDIRPPEVVPVRSWTLLYVLGGLLLGGLLAYGIYRFVKRPRPAPALPAKPPEPLHVRTLAALDELASEGLPEQGRYKEFYFRLSEIVRGYLGERYRFEALESTSGELLDKLRALHTPGLPMEDLAAFCHEADLVKFAKATVGQNECKSALELGYRIVHLTTAALLPQEGHADVRAP